MDSEIVQKSWVKHGFCKDSWVKHGSYLGRFDFAYYYNLCLSLYYHNNISKSFGELRYDEFHKRLVRGDRGRSTPVILDRFLSFLANEFPMNEIFTWFMKSDYYPYNNRQWCWEDRLVESTLEIDEISKWDDQVNERGKKLLIDQSKLEEKLDGPSHSVDVTDFELGRMINQNCNLRVSDRVIAEGSNEKIVYEGNFYGRLAAVKKMKKAHYKPNEVHKLLASDQHQNIVRYFGTEFDNDFVYVFFERCYCNLSDLIYGHSKVSPEQINSTFSTEFEFKQKDKDFCRSDLWTPTDFPTNRMIELIRGIVSGLEHLHSRGIIHRDLKPHNILIVMVEDKFVPKICDLGISKSVIDGSLTYSGSGGTAGWRAPEQLLKRRYSNAVDLFNLGAIIYFCLTGGYHPFGEHFKVDYNITTDHKLFSYLSIPEALDLVKKLLHRDPENRPSASEVLCHPLFWDAKQRNAFICDVSHRMGLEPHSSPLRKSIQLIAEKSKNYKGWKKLIHSSLVDDRTARSNYDFTSLYDLIRFMRNVITHYLEIPSNIRMIIGGVDSYFRKLFPELIIQVFNFVQQNLSNEDISTSLLGMSVGRVK